MSTVMEEKIKQAFQEWKQTEVKEQIVETQTRNQTLSNMLLARITAHPGVTGKELRGYTKETFPEVPVSYVPAILKGFYDKNLVDRNEVAPDGAMGRTTYSYTIIPAHERASLPKRPKIKAYTKKKGKAHTKVAKPVHEDKGISALVPAERVEHVERVVTSPLTVGATTVYITIHTGSKTTYSLRLEEAKVIYQQLNQIFGGVR